VKQRQELRKSAASNQIEMRLSSPSGRTARGDTFVAEVLLSPVSVGGNIYTAGVDLNFNPDVLEVSEVTCGSALPLPVKNTVEGSVGKIYLTCAKSGGQPPLVIQNQTVFGSFRVKIKDSAQLGLTSISFSEALAPDFASVDNLVSASNPLGFIVTALAVEPTPTPPGPQTFSETGGTIERTLNNYWCSSWYFGCWQSLPVLETNYTISRVSVDLRWYAINTVFLQIKEGTNYVSPVKSIPLRRRGRNWVNFDFNPPVSLCAGKNYSFYLKKSMSGKVTWFTKGGDSLSTIRNFKAWLVPGGDCQAVVAGQPTPTSTPTLAIRTTPTPILPSPTPTPTLSTSGDPNIVEQRGNNWVNAGTSYSTGCNLAYRTKVNFPGQKIKRLDLDLKWGAGGGNITIAIQKSGTTVRLVEKTIYLPGVAGEDWLTFDFSAAPVAVEPASYDIFLKKAGSAMVQWRSAFVGPGSCDYARNHKIWLTQ